MKSKSVVGKSTLMWLGGLTFGAVLSLASPAYAQEAEADFTLHPATPAAGMLAATQGSRFVCRDPQFNHNVEYYSLPAGWKGFGKVEYNLNPTGFNIFRWHSGFYNTQGAKVYLESAQKVKFPTPIKDLPFLRDKNQLAKAIKAGLLPRTHVQDIQLKTITIADSQNAALCKLAQEMTAYGKRTNANSRAIPLEAHALFSFSKNGQPWTAESEVFFVAWETPLACNHWDTLVDFELTVSYIYPNSISKQFKKEACKIAISRQIDQEWSDMVAAVELNIAMGNVDAARKQAETWRQTSEEISDMRRDSYNKKNESDDRISKKRSDQIRGQETYSDPFGSGRSVVVENNGKHAWTNSSGKVIYVDSGNYNPNSDNRLNNQEWRQVR